MKSEDEKMKHISLEDVIDDQGMVRVLATGVEMHGIEISLTVNNPDTGEETIIKNSISIPSSKAYLSQLKDSGRLRAKEELEQANLLLETDSAILKKISNVIEYREGSISTITNNLMPLSISPTQLLFRVRKIEDWDEPIKSIKDLSYVPDDKIEKIRYGRLNNQKEQIMYLADSHITAMKESRLKKGDKFYLSLFINIDQLNLVNISQQLKNQSDFGKVEKKISDFLLAEFTKTVREGEEHKYRISNLIAKHFYNYAVHGLDGWIYPSVAEHGAKNIALDKKITDKKTRFLVSFYGEQTSDTDFTLENPLIKNIEDDSLTELIKVLDTGMLRHYNAQEIEMINTFWLGFNREY